ncbi:hypothetical protein B0T26DRAFT_637160 [Lasiosphaeria miniovina]|uniref:MYND-type domain-containing protein n=1 Tax=Lasiosphaeria miniovina TaxID=1954250 RepID=A0AA40B3J4_9PEZI|nr:uncharacterized protein B0T26DRAFT_637160 [Lasiosphaeria miniovina]KAK0727030.1 hypothetical protein B0T26DRAFT_637160 [Lasiosphaeria miniovina]
MVVPDFADTAAFPTFAGLPEIVTTASQEQQAENNNKEEDWFLLGQIKDDMTITQPTLVLFDRAGSPFALMFDGLGPGAVDFRARGLRKGSTAVVPRAHRTPPKDESKRGFVALAPEDAGSVRAVPGPLPRVIELGKWLRERRAAGAVGCDGCWREDGEMKKCTACGELQYCGKECQAKAWNDSHKIDCKMIKAIDAIWKHDD